MNLKRQVTQILIVPMVLLALAVGGCSSTNAKNYPTLKQTQTNVSWPMTRFHNAVRVFAPITMEEQERVEKAYVDYDVAFEAAVQAAHGNLDAPTPDNVKALATEVIRVVETIPYR
jgi:hypothetical protein